MEVIGRREGPAVLVVVLKSQKPVPSPRAASSPQDRTCKRRSCAGGPIGLAQPRRPAPAAPPSPGSLRLTHPPARPPELAHAGAPLPRHRGRRRRRGGAPPCRGCPGWHRRRHPSAVLPGAAPPPPGNSPREAGGAGRAPSRGRPRGGGGRHPGGRPPRRGAALGKRRISAVPICPGGASSLRAPATMAPRLPPAPCPSGAR